MAFLTKLPTHLKLPKLSYKYLLLPQPASWHQWGPLDTLSHLPQWNQRSQLSHDQSWHARLSLSLGFTGNLLMLLILPYLIYYTQPTWQCIVQIILLSHETRPELKTAFLDGAITTLGTWRALGTLVCLMFSANYIKNLQTLNKDMRIHHTVVLEFLILEDMQVGNRLMEKPGSSKSNTKAIEWWLNHGNQSKETKVSHFLREVLFLSACR